LVALLKKTQKTQKGKRHMEIKKFIISIATNKFLHLFLGLMTVYAGASEAWETIVDDFSSAHIRASHGVIFLGAYHLLRSLAEFVESADYFKESIE
tara:strand:+ start:9969 stop:10256 length:288 start_codon:yes stop_codon:yes gene_type:complete